MKKVIAVIPARYAATRFPAKLMQRLGDKPVICHTYDAVLESRLFDDVYVVTDSTVIFDEITGRGGKAIMSVRQHESGTDRIAEAVENMEVEVVVNVQGDEPFIQKEPLEKLVNLFEKDGVQVASLMRRFEADEDVQNPNAVKVVTNQNGKALYFSRSVIPFPRDEHEAADYFLHLGVYGFRKESLLKFTTWSQSQLEKIEKLEQLRFLDHGVDIFMAETAYRNIAIDSPEDLQNARDLISK